MTSVSVVIAVRNGRPFVLESLVSALQQTRPPLEIIVVDGGSRDGTWAAVSAMADPRIRLVTQSGVGPAAARNEGIALARGEAIALLDADDVWHPRKLELQIARLESCPELGVVGCGYAIVDAALRETTTIRREDQDLPRWLMLEGNGLALTSTGLFPRQALEAIGGLDPELPYSGDLDLALRIAERWPVAVLDDVLVAYRSHPCQLHHDVVAYERDRLVILTRALAATPGRRRRALANLYTRLLCYDLAAGRWASACRRLPRLVRRPDRLVVLPAAALVRRGRRRRRGRAEPAQPWADFVSPRTSPIGAASTVTQSDRAGTSAANRT